MVHYEPLHHKYRPRTFTDLVGQEAIATILTNAIRSRRIAPAYLFTGPRGTGKTSSARILAKSLNCLAQSEPTPEPCGVCEVCRAIALGSALDVIEIDAASNTGVDNIRELIERAQFAPVQCRFKVYVLDEVHMLSAAAFNALLKTLEEPPERVVFVLATTDPQRVLPTIISRCQRFDFRRIPLEAIVKHLSAIAAQEKITIAETALQLVAQISQGGLRDAESLLDQLSLLSGEITVERVWDLVGAVPEQDLLLLLEAIAANNPEVVLQQAQHLMERGREPLVVLQSLAGFYRDLLIARTAPNRPDLAALTSATWTRLCEFAQQWEMPTILAGQQHLRTCEAQVKNTTQPRLWLEIALLGLLPAAQVSTFHAGSAATGSPQVKSVNNFQMQQATPVAVTPPVAKVSDYLPTASAAPMAVPPAAIAPVGAKPEATPLASTPSAAQEPQTPLPVEPLPQPAHPVSPAGPELVPTSGAQAQPAPQSTPQPAATDLNQVWQQVLAQLHPPGTQALLRQQAHLLAFKGRDARVGIRSQPLFKMAQERLKNIETAFEAVVGHPVKVKLEVAAVPEPESLSGGESQTLPTVSPAQVTAPYIGDRQLSSPAQAAAPIPSEVSPTFNQPPTSKPVQVEATLSASQAPEVSSWNGLDEVTVAARSLAQFFNGALVNLDETMPVESSSDLEALPERLSATTISAAVVIETELEETDEDELPF